MLERADIIFRNIISMVVTNDTKDISLVSEGCTPCICTETADRRWVWRVSVTVTILLYAAHLRVK